MPSRLLVLGPSWLGDAVMAAPTLEGLRRAFPDAHLAVVARGGVAGLYDLVPAVDEVVRYRRSPGLSRLGGYADLVRRLKQQRADAALVLPRSFGAAWTAVLADAPRRIGYAASGRDFLLTDPVERRRELLRTHRVHYFQHLLTAFGCEPEPEAPRLAVGADALQRAEALLAPLAGRDGPRVAFVPGANYGVAKQWPEEAFVLLARRLVDAGCGGIVLLGGPGDRDVCDRIRAAIDHPAVLDLAGRTGIPELAAVLAGVDLAVANDTGAMHVAAAVGTRVVALFGPTDPVTTGPYGPGHVVLREPVECAPCLLRTCPIDHRCMTRLDVERVLGACRTLLSASLAT